VTVRRVDAAILPGIKGHLKVHAVPPWKHTAVVTAAHDHELAQRARLSLGALDGKPMVRREAGSMTQKKIDEAFRLAGVKPAGGRRTLSGPEEREAERSR
jgi:hypothetical protein